MNDELAVCLHATIALVWADNRQRREYMRFSLGSWPIANLIEAPLGMIDLYVAARRQVGNVTRADIELCLDRFTLWRQEFNAPYGRGTYDYRLLAVGPERSVILRLGEHPNNGVMAVLTAEENPELERELRTRLSGAPVSGEGAVPPLNAHEADEKVADALVSALRSDGGFTSQGIASEVAEAMGQEEASDELLRTVSRQIAGWSHRLAIVSMQSTLGDVLAFDLLRLPNGKAHVTEWPDEGEVRSVAEVDPADQEEVFRVLRTSLQDHFEDGQLTGCDWVTLGRTLSMGETYPVEDEAFWRDLLGFPYVLEGGTG